MEAKPLHILVVEDHTDIRRILGLCLEMLGHRAEIVGDTGSALARAGSADFDVVLTDIGLPGRDGWELLRELRARGQFPPVAISMSACNTGQETARSRAAGCHAHLLKPFKIEELEAALQPVGP